MQSAEPVKEELDRTTQAADQLFSAFESTDADERRGEQVFLASGRDVP